MNPILASALLLLSPIALTGAIGAVMRLVRNWRKSWGAYGELPAAMIAAVIGFVIVHIGYYLSPVLVLKNHATLALGLVSPVAILVCVGLIWLHVRLPVPNATKWPRLRRLRTMIFGGLLATYLLPVVVLLMCR